MCSTCQPLDLITPDVNQLAKAIVKLRPRAPTGWQGWRRRVLSDRDPDPGDRPGPGTRRVAAPYQLGTDVPLLELYHLCLGSRAIDFEDLIFAAAYRVLGEANLGLGDAYTRCGDSVRASGCHCRAFAEADAWSVGRAGVGQENRPGYPGQALIQFSVVARFHSQDVRVLRGEGGPGPEACACRRWLGIVPVLVSAGGQAPGQGHSDNERQKAADCFRSPRTRHGPSLRPVHRMASHLPGTWLSGGRFRPSVRR